jgi:DNA-3-methyladenine glycosylase II
MSAVPEARPRRRLSHAAAAEVLATRDPVLADLIARAGPIRIRRASVSHFEALVHAVVHQQLAGPAAKAIEGRLIGVLHGNVEPEALLALSEEKLRAVGLSANKALSLHDLAAKVLDGQVRLAPVELSRQSDEKIIACLTTVRGIGRWSAEMFLMFQLGRLDVWPVGDYGVRRGYGLAWRIPTPTARELDPLGDPYRPYRTVLTWYCWRAAELLGGAAQSELTR